jgi:hypothetical protein
MTIEPYYVPISVLLPNIENAIQIYGSIYQNLYVLLENNAIYRLIPDKQKILNKDFSLKIAKIFVENNNDLKNGQLKQFSFKNPYWALEDSEESHNESEDKDKSSNEKQSNEDNNNNNINNNEGTSYDIDSKNKNNIESDSVSDNEFDNNIIKQLKEYEGDDESEKKEESDNEFSGIKHDNNLLRIKGLVYDYIIMNDNSNIYIRNKDSLDLIIKRTIKSIFYVLYNCHILISNPNNKYNISFCSIPDLEVVSIVQVTEPIIRFLIPNKNTFLIIGNHSIEQLELNTWKKISILVNENMFNFNESNMDIVGNNKELFLFYKGEIFIFRNNN